MSYGGYTGKILKVDLTAEKFSELSTWDYVPDFIGGVGIGYKILWDETDENTNEWSEDNTLIFCTGAASGTGAPSSGRTEVVGIAPQGYPKPWAAPSGIGSDIAAKLKFAGYDAVAIKGKAENPKYLYIGDEGPQLLDAENYWGMATDTVQGHLMTRHGKNVAIACIGPAGENRVRFATIMSRDHHSAGQGGFGAVMGDKKLKAMVVMPGTGKIPVSNPEVLINEIVKVSKIHGAFRDRNLVSDKGTYVSRSLSNPWGACSNCLDSIACNMERTYTGLGSFSGSGMCVGTTSDWAMTSGTTYQQRMEMTKLMDRAGLNIWELCIGMNWFIQNAYHAGRLNSLMGESVELYDKDHPDKTPKAIQTVGIPPELFVKFIEGIAYRKGEGDIWAEGTPRAADLLGLSDLAPLTHQHGYGPHWDGRYLQFVHYPLTVIAAAIRAIDPRDPFNQQHCYKNYWNGFKEVSGRDNDPSYAELCEAFGKVYGAENAWTGWDAPELGYVDKEYTVRWHNWRGIMLCGIGLCDWSYCLPMYDPEAPDKVGYMDAEVNMFNAIVGTDWSLDDMHKACARVWSLMRAINVRQGRTRADDESVIPYHTQTQENGVGCIADYPDEAGPRVVDIDEFKGLLNRIYDLHGWDTEKGWPTRQTLETLGLKGVADELESLGKLP